MLRRTRKDYSMNTKTKFTIAGVCGILLAILIVMLKTVDVAPIGPEGTSIGLSHLNKAANEFFGQHDIWYDITKKLGYVGVLPLLIFALVGLVQLIKRKSLLKIDKDLYALAGLYVAIIGVYALFEKVIINYRPMIMAGDEHVEASFPSSHTLLACGIVGSTIILLSKYIKNDKLRMVLTIICLLIIFFTAIGRLLAGVHWLTDVIGGILASGILLAAFSGVRDIIDRN